MLPTNCSLTIFVSLYEQDFTLNNSPGLTCYETPQKKNTYEIEIVKLKSNNMSKFLS